MATVKFVQNLRVRRHAVFFMAFTVVGTACTDGSAPSENGGDDGKHVEPSSDDDEDPSEEPAKPAKDAGARTSTKIDAGGKDAAGGSSGSKTSGTEDAGSGADAAPSGSSASWCDAKPVVEKYCTACHDGAGTGGSPMALLTPADFAAPSPGTPSDKVYQRAAARIHDDAKPMPPKAKLSADELATLDAWLAAGAPAGNDSNCGGQTAPAPGVDGRVDGWDPSKCDEVYELRAHGPGGKDDPYVVPAGQEIHPQISVDAPWGSETVQAIAFKPITDNKKVTHHWIMSGGGNLFIAGWAPGDDQRPPVPDDVAIQMPSGPGAFNFDFHYFNLTGSQDEPDRSGVAICVLKQAHFRPKLAGVTASFSTFGDGFVLAPAGANNTPQTGVCNINTSETIHVITRAPHAHKYATHMKFTVTKKDGTEIVMHDQPFTFGEQGTYPIEGGEILLETGDTVYTTCSYTNASNRNITFGESTENEMCFNFALYYPKGAFSCGGGGGIVDLGSLFGAGGP